MTSVPRPSKKVNASYYEAKHDVAARRKMARGMSPAATGFASRVSIWAIEKRGMGRARMAVITIAKNDRDYYDPMVAFQKQIAELSRPIAPVKSLAPETVESTAITDAKRENNFIRWKTAFRRMRKITGQRHTVCWRSKFDRFGMFFLYPEKVLYQSWSHDGGWVNIRVPEDGLEISR